MSIQPLVLSLCPLTVELPAADTRPPAGSLTYPVQTWRQLHGAKLVPVGVSPIQEQHPGAAVHPQDRYSLQSTDGTTSAGLFCVGERCYNS